MKLKAVAAVLFALPFSVTAHHSRAEYDSSIVTEMRGTVESVRWTNPHVRMTVAVLQANGETTSWELEGMDVTRLDRAGIPRDLVEPGMTIDFAGDSSRRRANAMYVKHVLLPDRTELLLSSGIEPRWDGAVRVVGFDFPLTASTEIESDIEPPSGIFRVWFPGRIVDPAFAGDPPFMPAARQLYESYDSSRDDPVLDCTPPGMPRLMTRTGFRPIEFVDAGDRILIRTEPFALVREIDMSGAGDSGRQPPRPLGYSRGRWDNDTLVVTTTAIDWPYFQLYGFEGAPQSSETEITERFTVSEDQLTLRYDISANDPLTFTEPVTADRYRTYEWRPGGALMPYEECTTRLSD